MYQSLPPAADRCSALLSAKRACHVSVREHSISQPQTRSATPTTVNSSSSSNSRRGISRPSSHPHSHDHCPHDPSTPTSSQFFSNTIDPLMARLDEDTDRGSDADHQVKLALTDLLNCADVRADAEIRLWVQNRLMDVEQRLKARRKSHILGVR